MTSSPPPLAAEAIGLPAAAVAAIRQVLASHPEVESAILYGSRTLSHPALLEHIERAGVVLHQRQVGVAGSAMAD